MDETLVSVELDMRGRKEGELRYKSRAGRVISSTQEDEGHTSLFHSLAR